MAESTLHRSQRVVVHARCRDKHELPDGEVMLHKEGMLQDITGSIYVRMTPEEWDCEYALPEHQPKDRRSRRN